MKSVQREFVTSLDSLIRNGQASLARTQLLKIDHLKFPKEMRVEIASLACRADLADLSVRILHPVIYPPKGSPSTATERERAEYAKGLIRIGAVGEGMSILRRMNPTSYPSVYFLMAVGYIERWEYQKAIRCLEDAIRSPGLDPYQKLICRSNLASSLVHERRFAEAATMLEELKGETAASAPILHANVLKYWAELKIETHDFEGARKLLSEAKEKLEHVGGKDSLLLRKWIAIAQLIESKADAISIDQIHQIKDEARTKRDFETVRDCDFYKAIHCHNEVTFLRVYFGTPFECYRERILGLWNAPLDIPDTYVWILKRGEQIQEFNLLAGEKTAVGDKLKVGQAMHRLLATLSSDFYRPFRVAALHAAIFPDEHFDPVSSRKRVHFAIHRLRQWFADNRIPLLISENSQAYQLDSSSPCSLVVSRERAPNQDSSHHFLKQLENHFRSDFSGPDAEEFLKTSKNSALRVLAKGLEKGTLTRHGKGRATRYRFASIQIDEKAAA